MKWLFGLAVIVALALLWSLWGRNWLKARNWDWSNAFFAWIEPIEIRLWKNSKTIFKARLMMVLGGLLTVLTQAGAIDITPLMPLVPDAWEWLVTLIWNMIPLSLSLLGWLDEQLRKDTTEPLEVVATPEAVRAALPEVQEMEEAKAAAVEAVEIAKAEGGA